MLLVVLAATFWSASNFLVAVDNILAYLVNNPYGAAGDANFGISIIGTTAFGVLGVLTKIMCWAGTLLFCLRWAKVQSQSKRSTQEGNGSDDEMPAKDEDNLQPPELQAEVQFQTVHHDADSKAFVAELPGEK